MVTLEIPKFFKETDYKKELESFQWGMQEIAMGSGRRPGRAKFLPAGDVHVSMEEDQFTPEFHKRAVQGPAIPKVSIKLHKADGARGSVPYMEIILTAAFVASLNYEAGKRGNVVLSMTLNFKEGEFKEL